MNSLWLPSLRPGELVVRAVVVYAAVLALLRITGKRQVGQMGPAELVALLLLSNAVQNSMNGGDSSILGGVLLAAVLLAMSWLVSWATYRSPRLERLIDGRPTILVFRGEPVTRNLDKEHLTVRELKALLRRQGIFRIEDIHEAILEPNGALTIVRKTDVAPA